MGKLFLETTVKLQSTYWLKWVAEPVEPDQAEFTAALFQSFVSFLRIGSLGQNFKEPSKVPPHCKRAKHYCC